MDAQGFRQHLLARGLPEEQIPQQIDAMARFARHLGTLDPPQTSENVDAQATLAYADLLIAQSSNRHDSLLSLGARVAPPAGGTVSATFCRCSAGYHKKPWEVIFGQPLEADVLESVLQGDLRCRFAIHLPPGAPGMETNDDL